MIPKLLEKLFGANWKAATSQIGVAVCAALTTLAALPYSLGDIATIIPPTWKGKIVTVGIMATLVLRFINGMQQKAKNVTGGIIQQTADGSVATQGAHDQSSAVNETIQAAPKL